ncbi:PorT family protein [Hymenobacter sp. 15J16-1T3B]|uniref:outer membrane beta-barrel protein n=1 Tax=Hymenobacter sp. 15J16-1T3B TaxID=2886941 RepID=UPI001D12D5D3|nr:outer membrane beta-barrel protein [Hymenobacter sp. 15J16-1T3B]MCC3159613.1 PorT family protein [Hymenobacter sp. 15J16-1T3B]
MKRIILLAGLLAAAQAASAQTLRWRLKVGAGVTVATTSELAPRVFYPSTSPYPVFDLADPYAYKAVLQPGGSAGLAAHWQSATHWGLGAELLACHEPLRLERRTLPLPNELNHNDDPRTYRYRLPKLALPVYVSYRAGRAWQLRAGASPAVPLGRQVRITGGQEPPLVNGQVVATPLDIKTTDTNLRTLNWRLLLGVQYELTPVAALELSVLPAVTELTDTEQRAGLLVRRHLRQHALSLGVSYALGRR